MTARAGRQQEQDDSKSRTTARAGSPATAETLAQQQQQRSQKLIVNFLPKLALKIITMNAVIFSSRWCESATWHPQTEHL
jgi:hypothetical protein